MAELTPNAQKVYEALKKLGATSPEVLKTADDVMRAARLPKGMVNNALMELVAKGFAKRVAREKAAGYHLIK
ncbi:MAG: transcriptional regulator [Candidatus Hadarchaeum yellowstonense]|jgi:predicted transcriptional regulator|uniref:Transcriptional regulator n=1 Tax=Hadarchaeum yellowstonense TaxID=1776334 RepID=A0A147JU22_HADYE|nr:MAG: transcriptional regulator [Candidatus Hadarchaeum yellowstonense]